MTHETSHRVNSVSLDVRRKILMFMREY